jgi:hypothetical protein
MEILQEVQSVPARKKYAVVYDACEALAEGAVVAFKFDDEAEAFRVYDAIKKHHARTNEAFAVVKRGQTIYVERAG